jgi:hypothetical protein
MKKLILLPAAIAAIGISGLFVGDAFAAQGSGKSAEHRNDSFVVICHYDRNQQGPNAGPHTITVNANALDHHLANHVKKDGFIGDDHEGACTDATAEPTSQPTSEPTSVPTSAPD